MKNLIVSTLLGLAVLTASVIHSAAAPVPASVQVKGFYVDTGLSLFTPDFSHQEDIGYFVGVGYQFTPQFAADVRIAHAGMDIEGQAVESIGGRLVARLPWELLAPYGFLGAEFNLGPDQWRLQPGLGVEIGVTKLMKGLSLFGEGGLDADLKGRNGYRFAAGVKLRFGK